MGVSAMQSVLNGILVHFFRGCDIVNKNERIRRYLMKEYLYKLVGIAADIHEKILHLNDAYEYNLSDKQLHFLVIGFVGMAMLFVIHPIIVFLVKKGYTLTISWLYVFTLILVLTFAIEIGQKITNTGKMEFSDIVFGIGGFLLMFLIFAIFRALIHVLVKQLHKTGEKRDTD